MMTAAQKAAKHRLNTANRERADAKQPAVHPWTARRIHVQLERDVLGEWYVRVVRSDGVSPPIPASDYEVSLWLDLCETRAALRKMQETTA